MLHREMAGFMTKSFSYRFPGNFGLVAHDSLVGPGNSCSISTHCWISPVRLSRRWACLYLPIERIEECCDIERKVMPSNQIAGFVRGNQNAKTLEDVSDG